MSVESAAMATSLRLLRAVVGARPPRNSDAALGDANRALLSAGSPTEGDPGQQSECSTDPGEEGPFVRESEPVVRFRVDFRCQEDTPTGRSPTIEMRSITRRAGK